MPRIVKNRPRRALGSPAQAAAPLALLASPPALPAVCNRQRWRPLRSAHPSGPAAQTRWHARLHSSPRPGVRHTRATRPRRPDLAPQTIRFRPARPGLLLPLGGIAKAGYAIGQRDPEGDLCRCTGHRRERRLSHDWPTPQFGAEVGWRSERARASVVAGMASVRPVSTTCFSPGTSDAGSLARFGQSQASGQPPVPFATTTTCSFGARVSCPIERREVLG